MKNKIKTPKRKGFVPRKPKIIKRISKEEIEVERVLDSFRSREFINAPSPYKVVKGKLYNDHFDDHEILGMIGRYNKELPQRNYCDISSVK